MHVLSLTTKRDDLRSDTVQRAYDTVVSVQCLSSGRASLDPRDHVARLDQHLLHGFHIVEWSRLDEACHAAAWSGAGCAPRVHDLASDVDADDFDPARHIVVVTAPSYLAHLEPSQLGAGANLERPDFKTAVLWWETNATGTPA